MRPTAFTCPAPATPATSVPKINGAMIILISRKNSWLNGLKNCAHVGMRPADQRADGHADDEAQDDLLSEGEARWPTGSAESARCIARFYPIAGRSAVTGRHGNPNLLVIQTYVAVLSAWSPASPRGAT